ncbi:MAG: aspartate/glutamate racemase family protein, partial [Saprospiraceae bacterium]|nr:aspartate/glutamate racemase family protein [Saprospiraceae bacterium]
MAVGEDANSGKKELATTPTKAQPKANLNTQKLRHSNTPMIGIVGGIGPMAGVDLYKQIVENTIAATDQEHLPVLLASLPNEITDRTSFLLGLTDKNPASALARVIMLLNNAGCTHVGIACNTAHAPQIYEPMVALLGIMGSRVELVHMIEEVIRQITLHPAQPQRIGILSTIGTYKTRIYQNR